MNQLNVIAQNQLHHHHHHHDSLVQYLKSTWLLTRDSSAVNKTYVKLSLWSLFSAMESLFIRVIINHSIFTECLLCKGNYIISLQLTKIGIVIDSKWTFVNSYLLWKVRDVSILVTGNIVRLLCWEDISNGVLEMKSLRVALVI